MGNKTKSALATAIAQRSRLLILDEPTTGLDPVALDALLRVLVEDCTAEGRTIFLSSHQLAEIEQIADHIGIMDRGKLLMEGPLDDLRSSFRRVTATGAALPTSGLSILNARRQAVGSVSVRSGICALRSCRCFSGFLSTSTVHSFPLCFSCPRNTAT
jgi:ABC-type multidrug transport system ATPase subunit